MAPGTATTPSQCEDRTIILPIGQEEYEKIVPHHQFANKFPIVALGGLVELLWNGLPALCV